MGFQGNVEPSSTRYKYHGPQRPPLDMVGQTTYSTPSHHFSVGQKFSSTCSEVAKYGSYLSSEHTTLLPLSNLHSSEIRWNKETDNRSQSVKQIHKNKPFSNDQPYYGLSSNLYPMLVHDNRYKGCLPSYTYEKKSAVSSYLTSYDF